MVFSTELSKTPVCGSGSPARHGHCSPKGLHGSHLFVGHGMVPPKQPRRDVVSNDHVDGVVFVRHEDADDAGSAQQPADQMIPPEVPRRIWTAGKQRWTHGLAGWGWNPGTYAS